MPGTRLRVSQDLAVADWIAPRLGGPFGAVSRTVPAGFAAYARICHPPGDPAGELTTWARVAAATGRRAHALMQWHALAGAPEQESRWPGAEPRTGHLAPQVLGVVCDVLAAHTSTPESCRFGLWNGWGGIGDGVEMLGNPRAREAASPLPALLRLPGRDYLLFAGPVHVALDFGSRPAPAWFVPQSPNIFWPADRAWFAATEIDFDSTLVGGSRELVDALLAAPALDSWPVAPSDSLAADADRINAGS